MSTPANNEYPIEIAKTVTQRHWLLRFFVDNVIARLSLYYVFLIGLFNLLLVVVPGAREDLARERVRFAGQGADLDLNVVTPGVASPGAEVLIPALFSLLGALALALPVAWVYQWTRGAESYRRDFGRSLIVLPFAVALAVFLVKGSLALAFSLAGIVAAIRWRAALKETIDGVFVFVVIGIGLAAAVQLLTVALVASMFFNIVVLGLAYVNYADRPRQLVGWTLVPAKPAVRTRETVTVRVKSSSRGSVEADLETTLAEFAKSWRKQRSTELPDGLTLIEYDAALKKRHTVDDLRNAFAKKQIPQVVELIVEPVIL